MNDLNQWLQQATRHLSSASAARVRSEIREHYEAEREAAISCGAPPAEAERSAVAALGDPKIANCEYRKVLLTSSEARLLRDSKWEARAVCSRSWLKPVFLGIPVLAIMASAILFFTGSFALARVLLAAGIGVGLSLAAPFLPIRFLSRARFLRPLKWVALTAALILAFGPDAMKWSWLLASSLWPLFWIEWTRVSIRRKLPVAEWPRHLYL